MDQSAPKPRRTAIIVKQIVAATLLATVWVFMLFYLERGLRLLDYQYWIAPAALILALVPAVSLAALALPRRIYAFLSLGLAGAYFAFFPITIFALPIVALLFFGLWRAYHRTHFELKNNIKFAANHILKRAGSILLLALLLAISVNVYARISQEVQDDPTGFYARLAVSVTKGVLPVVERQLDGFNPSDTLDQFIVNGFIESSPEFLSLPAEEREQQIRLSRQRLADQFDINVSGEEPLSDITKHAIEAQIQNLVSPRYHGLVPLVYSLAIFSLLRILSVVGLPLAQSLGIFFFWLLRKTEFIRITSTQISAEHVEI